MSKSPELYCLNKTRFASESNPEPKIT